jgi:hypothetical protein
VDSLRTISRKTGIQNILHPTIFPAVHCSSVVCRNELAPLLNHRLHNTLPLLPDMWSTFNSGEYEYLLVHRSACTIRRVMYNSIVDEQSHLQPVHGLCCILFAADVVRCAVLLVLVVLFSDFMFSKSRSRYCAFTDRSANSKCTSLSMRWQYDPSLLSLSRPFTSSMPLGHHRKTCFVLHCLFHSPIRLTGSTDRPTLSCTLSGDSGSKSGV